MRRATTHSLARLAGGDTDRTRPTTAQDLLAHHDEDDGYTTAPLRGPPPAATTSVDMLVDEALTEIKRRSQRFATLFAHHHRLDANERPSFENDASFRQIIGTTPSGAVDGAHPRYSLRDSDNLQLYSPLALASRTETSGLGGTAAHSGPSDAELDELAHVLGLSRVPAGTSYTPHPVFIASRVSNYSGTSSDTAVASSTGESRVARAPDAHLDPHLDARKCASGIGADWNAPSISACSYLENLSPARPTRPALKHFTAASTPYRALIPAVPFPLRRAVPADDATATITTPSTAAAPRHKPTGVGARRQGQLERRRAALADRAAGLRGAVAAAREEVAWAAAACETARGRVAVLVERCRRLGVLGE
ncbi:hypothetical protein DFJ73DRAFT_792533 [Zopfochytrium polystomum]|nr:hypothetical protein DFJ73DRAFT_792533 [Zopfochytrium polystomum]